jgi:hypothetical protein
MKTPILAETGFGTSHSFATGAADTSEWDVRKHVPPSHTARRMNKNRDL